MNGNSFISHFLTMDSSENIWGFGIFQNIKSTAALLTSPVSQIANYSKPQFSHV